MALEGTIFRNETSGPLSQRFECLPSCRPPSKWREGAIRLATGEKLTQSRLLNEWPDAWSMAPVNSEPPIVHLRGTPKSRAYASRDSHQSQDSACDSATDSSLRFIDSTAQEGSGLPWVRCINSSIVAVSSYAVSNTLRCSSRVDEKRRVF